MNMRHLLRMARWAKRPPSEKRVKLVLGVVLICLILVGIEWAVGFPEWLVPDNAPKGRL